MTNYRIEMCADHDLPQFKVCFDCGSPVTFRNDDGEAKVYGCSAMSFHLMIWAYPHEGPMDEGECREMKFI